MQSYRYLRIYPNTVRHDKFVSLWVYTDVWGSIRWLTFRRRIFHYAVQFDPIHHHIFGGRCQTYSKLCRLLSTYFHSKPIQTYLTYLSRPAPLPIVGAIPDSQLSLLNQTFSVYFPPNFLPVAWVTVWRDVTRCDEPRSNRDGIGKWWDTMIKKGASKGTRGLWKDVERALPACLADSRRSWR